MSMGSFIKRAHRRICPLAQRGFLIIPSLLFSMWQLGADGPSIVTAQADDGEGHTFPLAVEWVGRLPGFDWITVVVAKLPDELTGAAQALISVNAHSQTSNQVSVAISPLRRAATYFDNKR